MSDLTIPPPPLRLPLPLFRIARERPASQPGLIGRWIEAKLFNGDYDRLNCAERADLRTVALLLESWAPPEPKRRAWWEKLTCR
jgi:hypothetical protein